MTTLGVVLAGGHSRRFGGDKALAIVDGQAMLARALAHLAGCDALAVAGRDWPGVTGLADWPQPGLGPLGGLAGALRHAVASGHGVVASLPVDCVMLPSRWRAALGDGPACATGQPLVAVWPAGLASDLQAFVGGGGRRVHDWLAHCGARRVDLGPIANINSRDDLAALGG